MIGRLIWNQDRPDIAFATGMLYGGLHCGDCFAFYLDDHWIDVRLEYADDWVLIHNGHFVPDRYGILVSI